MCNSFAVSYGSSPCKELQFEADNSKITCSLAYNDKGLPQIVSGDLIPQVHILNIGFAIIDPSVVPLEVIPTISDVSPSIGSTAGDVNIAINGGGFGLSLDKPSETSVKIGNSECLIISLSNTQIVCKTGYKTTDSNLVLSVNGKIYQNSLVFIYNDQNTPTISASTPKSSSPVLYTIILIDGSNFGPIKNDMSVTLLSINASSSDKYDCFINSVSFSQISCTLVSFI